MASSVEYGYLGTTSVESGLGLSRQPTLVGGEAVYTPYLEGAWANELKAADGRLRFLYGGQANGRGAGNMLDTALADNFTIMALVRADNNTNFSQFMQKGAYGGTDFIALTGNGNAISGPVFNLKRSPANGSVNPAAAAAAIHRKPQSWQWVTGQRINGGGSNTKLAVWANGAKRVVVDGTAGPIGNDQPVSIDAEGAKVRVACFMIFARVLSDAEVMAVMSGAKMPKTIPDLVAYYKFNDIEGSQCTDHSGAGNHLVYNWDACRQTEEYSPDGNIARQFTAAWTTPAGFSTSGRNLYLNNPPVSSGADRLTAGLVKGQRYKVSFTISNANASTAVRIGLYSQDGYVGTTLPQSANGTYTQTVMIGPGSGSGNGTILVQAQNGTTVCTISNLSVIPESAVAGGGLSGQPYVERPRRGLAQTPANQFRSPPSLQSAAGQGSIVTGIGTTVSVPDSPSMRLAGDLTILGWIKLTGASPVTLWSKGTTEGSLEVASGGKTLTFSRNGAQCALQLDRPIPLTTWASVGVTWANGFAIFYVGSVPVGAQAFTPGTPAFTAAPATLGATSIGRPTPLRSVRVYSRALSAAEIDSLFWTDNASRADPSLVGEWLGNEIWNSQVKDTSAYANHGAVNPGVQVAIDSPYWYPRRKNVGKQLGVTPGSYLTVPGLGPALHGAATITLTGKVKTSAAAVSQPLLTLYAPVANKAVVWLYRNVSGFLQGILMRATPDSQVFSGISRIHAGDAQWRSYAIEFSCVAKTVKIYVDGVLIFTGPIGTTTGAGIDLTGESAMRFGYLNSAAAIRSYYDDLRVYSRALSDDEHRAIFLGRAPRTGLVAEYSFDNDASSALDTSGNGFHALWSGMSLSDYVQIT